MRMFNVKHYERGWSEVLKIIRDLIQPDLCYLELDGRKVGSWDCCISGGEMNETKQGSMDKARGGCV